MSNYIDKDKLIRDLIDNRNFYPAIVKNAIENAPTEDVVPRAEVEKAKQEVAREIFDILEEIFKKYEQLYKNEMCELLFEDIGTEIYSLKKYIGE